MKLLTLLSMSLATLAAPSKLTISKRFDAVPYAPATPEQGPFDKCTAETHQRGKLSHTADMLDCLEIGSWARQNNGVWVLKATTDPSDPDDWLVLREEGSCALIVKNTQPTQIGNQDVVDLIEAVHLGDGIRLGPVEEVGAFAGCQGDATVRFWLRSSTA